MELKPPPSRLSFGELSRHLYVIGQSGVGKSMVLLTWLLQLILQGVGVALLDPSADLFQAALSFLADYARKIPELAERVVIIDPMSTMPVGINPVQVPFGITPEENAWFLSDILGKIWQMPDAVGTRMTSLFFHTVLMLSELNLTLVELPLILREEKLRMQLLRKIHNPEVVSYFLHEFPKSHREQTDWKQSTLNRFGAFVAHPAIRLMFGQKETTIDLRQIMDGGKILLVNLDKGRLSQGRSQLFGAFLVSMIQQEIMRRADRAYRPLFSLILDEWQNYTTDSIEEIITESRKWGLSLVAAHQYLDQVSEELQAAVLNNAGTIVCFRVSYKDAKDLAREIFTPAIDATRQMAWHPPLMPELAIPTGNPQFRPLEAEWEERAFELVNLGEREFWVRRRGPWQPVKYRSFELSVPSGSAVERMKDHLIAVSGKRYGRDKNELWEEINVQRPRDIRELAKAARGFVYYEENQGTAISPPKKPTRNAPDGRR